MPLATPSQRQEIVRQQQRLNSRGETAGQQAKRHRQELAARGVPIPPRPQSGKD
ncbi:MAG: hypothetical protein Q8M07_28745 [Prosthecobacter sp.]|nr:hypothetical protein [Prosthecobacter sp.]